MLVAFSGYNIEVPEDGLVYRRSGAEVRICRKRPKDFE
jgi:hypothetical protein